MKLKKVGLFLGIVPLLIACNKDPYAGEYVFQMGKSKDTHMSVSLKLTNEVYSEETPDKGKKFELALDMLTSDIESDMSSILNELTPITGYYKVNKEEKVYGEARLNIGLNLMGEYEIPENITDCIFVAGINDKTVNFYLPVSIEDLQFQLYWYGYDLNVANFFDDEVEDPLATPEGKHPVGTHPSKEDIDQINTHYGANHNDKVFRDFHVLKLGLTKQ